MARHPFTGEPPKEPPPTDPPYTGPTGPPKEPPADSAPTGPTGPTEPPKEPPAPDQPATAAVPFDATFERVEATQAPATGRVMRTESPSGRTEAFTGQEVEFSAPQAPGPAGDTGAP